MFPESVLMFPELVLMFPEVDIGDKRITVQEDESWASTVQKQAVV